MKILLAVDGSPHSREAVEEITRRPWPAGTVVRAMTAVQQVVPAAAEFALGGTWDQVWREQAKEAERLTASVAASLKETGLTVETVVRQGDPRTEIIDEATTWGSDLIVVGSHGHSRLERLLLGSVAQSIVSHAPCSVEVVRRRQQPA